MTTKPRIIAEDVILPTHFLSATEQEGVYLGQPEPDNDNSGYLKPISIGPYFGSLSLDATVASGGHSSIFKTTGFDIYGDDYFINCKMRALKQFVDSGDTGHSPVAEGAIPVADVKRFGSHGIYFNGTTDFISIADHANFDVQANFSIDLWVKHTDHVGDEYYVSQYESADEDWALHHWHSGGLEFYIRSGGVHIVTTGYGGEITDTNWHHILMAKVGNEYGVYKDGQQVAYVNDASMATFNGPLEIGRYGADNYYFDGHMDEIRIYHGNPFGAAPNAGLTNTITVPTAPHESDSDTKLLLHGNVAERTISDFEQDGGKITVESAFDANLATLEAFQVTKDKDDVDFRLELTTGGDIGDAKFKWSYDGGVNYFGRGAIAANWLAEVEIDNDNPGSAGTAIIQAQNGDWLAFASDTSGHPFVRISSDQGMTWGSRIEISTGAFAVSKTLLLSSGRILLFAARIFYSDDNGLTWPGEIISGVDGGFSRGAVELQNGNVLAAYNDGTDVKIEISYDGGLTWAALSTVSAAANTQAGGSLIQAQNGDIICAYSTDEDVLNAIEIKCKISTNRGSSWGAAIDVIDFVEDFEYPDLAIDIDGTLYLACERAIADRKIVFTYSTDNGADWDATGPRVVDLKAKVGTDIRRPSIALLDNQLICIYADLVGTDIIYMVRRGMWEKAATLATNACPVAIQSIEQSLIANTKIKWAGYAGIEEDKWSFGPEYYFAKENLLLDSPSLPWRSEEDDIETSIIIDLEENKGHPFNSVGLFGCNVRTLRIQASPVNETKGWILPPVDVEVLFDITTLGVIDSVVNNRIEDAALLADYSDHELRNHYMRMTSGVANGITYKIVDNVGNRFEILSDGGIKGEVEDTFAIYKTDISCFFTDPDTTEWANLGSLEISGSNNLVEEQDIAGNLYLSGSAATNNLTRLIVGGDATLSTNSHDNCITGIQCAGTITDHGTNNVIEAGDWFNYPYRYIRILIETQNTYEGYYQIGNMVLGEYTQLSRNWRVGYNINSNFGIEMIRTPHGGLSAIRKHDEIKTFNLSWHEIDDTNIELQKLIDYIGGRNVCLIPDGGVPVDCYLTKFTGVVKQRHTLLNRFDTSLTMEEVK